MATIFSDISELRAIQPIFRANLGFTEIEPYLQQALQKYFYPAMGKEEADLLVANYPGSLNAGQLLIILDAQISLANYGLNLALPYMNAQVGNLGIQEQSSKDGSSNGSRMWVYNEVKANAIEMADNHLDTVLGIMEDNVGSFTEWPSSTTYTRRKNLICGSLVKFEKWIPINGSRRLFQQIIPHLEPAQDTHIGDLLGADMYDEITTQIAAATLTADNTALVALLEPAAAFGAMLDALPLMRVMITSTGLRTSTSENSTDGNRSSEAARIEEKDRLIETFKAKLSQALKRANDLLYKAPDLYPTFKDSDTYEDTESNFSHLFDNEGRKSFMT